MTTSSKVAAGGTSRPNQVAELDPEPTLLAYRRPSGSMGESAEQASATSTDRVPPIILRIPHLQAELPGAAAPKSSAPAMNNKVFWGGAIGGVLLIALLLFTGKKSNKHDEVTGDVNGPRQAPGAAGPIAPLPGGQPLNMQPVPTYKEENPRAVPGRTAPMPEPGTLPPNEPSAPVTPQVDASYGVPGGDPSLNNPPMVQATAPPGPRPSDQFMGPPPQHIMPWRDQSAPPAEQGPTLGPADPRQGMNQPNRSPFTLPENDPRMGMPPGADQGARNMQGGPYQPGGPVYRTADRSGQSGASFEGIIVKPPTEGQYDRSGSRPY